MGDYTNMNLWVPKVPDGFAKHVQDAFKQYSGGYNHYVEQVDLNTGELNFGANDISVCSTEELAADLLRLVSEGVTVECETCQGEGYVHPEGLDEDDHPCTDCATNGEVTLKAPDFAFRVYEDPKYEWLGTIYIHVPGMADFLSECDADANVVVNPHALMEMVNKATDLDALRAEMARRTGEQHYAALTKT